MAQTSEIDFLNQASQAYILKKEPRVKQIVEEGLKQYPNSEKLKGIANLLNTDSNQQNQNKKKQNKQDNSKSNQDSSSKQQKQPEQNKNQDSSKQNKDKQEQDKQKDQKNSADSTHKDQNKKNDLDSNKQQQNQSTQNSDQSNSDQTDSSLAKQQAESLKELSQEEAKRILRSYQLSEKEQLKKIHTQPSSSKLKQDW